MELLSWCIALFVIIISLLWACYFSRNSGKSIPGPYGVPILGYLPFLRNLDKFRQFQQLSIKYGKIFQIKVGTDPVLVLNDWISIKEALINQKEVFSGRPNLFTFNIRFENKDITGQSSSPIWNHQRRFAMKTLRDMGMGKSASEMVILEEAEKLIAEFDAKSGQIINGEKLFSLPAINVILNIATGERYDYGSETAKHFATVFSKVFHFLSPSNIINVFPALRFFTNALQLHKQNIEIVKQYLIAAVNDHKSSFNIENEPKDYIDAYLQQLHQTSAKVRKDEICSFSDDRLIADLFVLFNGGTETLSSTMSFAMLYMSVWPNFQSKVQMEIDNTIGNAIMPQYADRQKLPYTQAVIFEIQRYASVGAFAIPHMAKCATQLCGFNIPANTTVWANLWALNNDPELWGDPEVFRPERFLGTDGKVSEPDYFIPFSAGVRRCIGELLARMEIFLFFAAVMQKFTFRLPNGHCPPSLEPVVDLALHPAPFQVIIENRN